MSVDLKNILECEEVQISLDRTELISLYGLHCWLQGNSNTEIPGDGITKTILNDASWHARNRDVVVRPTNMAELLIGDNYIYANDQEWLLSIKSKLEQMDYLIESVGSLQYIKELVLENKELADKVVYHSANTNKVVKLMQQIEVLQLHIKTLTGRELKLPEDDIVSDESLIDEPPEESEVVDQ